MLLDDAVTRIQRKLGMRSDLAAIIKDELADAQTKFERGIPIQGAGTYLPWFLLTDVQSLVTVIGDEKVATPADFLREYEEDALYNYVSTNTPPSWCPISKGDLDCLRAEYNGATGGPPGAYSLVGKYWRVFPTPDAVYNLRSIYYGADAQQATGQTNKWLTYAADLLIGEAGIHTAVIARDANPVDFFKGLRAEAIQALFVQTIEREEDNRPRAMGGDD